MNRFTWPVRIYYEDTDSGGVVYYANYLKFMERARTEWLRELGFEQDQLLSELDVIFAVRSLQVDYMLPARFNDELTVDVVVEDVGPASISLAQAVYKNGQDKPLCKGIVKIASLNGTSFKPCGIPVPIREKLN